MGNIDYKSVKIKNFKSIDNATLNIRAAITGIYGENGIGKTSVVELLELIKEDVSVKRKTTRKVNVLNNEEKVFDGFAQVKKIEQIIAKNIKSGKESLGYSIGFSIDNFCYTYYKEVFMKDGNFSSFTEKIDYYNVNKKGDVKEIYSRIFQKNESSSTFKYSMFKAPQLIDFDEITSDELLELGSVASDLVLCTKLYEKKNKLGIRNQVHIQNINQFVESLKLMSIIRLEEQSLMNLGICIPVNMHLNDKDGEAHGKLFVKQFTKYYPEEVYLQIKKTIDIINSLLSPISNGRKIHVEEYDKRLSELNETIEIAIELIVEQPSGDMINIEKESTGIIKLISILATFAEVSYNPNYVVVIDELDSHVYEYLLATLIEKLNDIIEGKLIFTSHNLTLFENLTAKNIVILQRDDSLNVDFAYLQREGSTSNLRDQYLRALYVGTDTIFEAKIKETKLARAFRKIKRKVTNNE